MTALELRVRIHRHLAAHPGAAMTALEVARALGFDANGVYRVKYQLARMASDGEVEHEVGKRTPSDHRQVVRWKVPMP